MSFNAQRPFNDLPRLPPLAELETKQVLKACIAARAAIAELRLAGQMIPDQSVLFNTIPLLEAKASSEIENIVTTNDALFREASQPFDGGGDATVKEALRYRQALQAGYYSLKTRPLTVRTALDVCTRIKNVEMDVRAVSGTALRNVLSGEVIYTPPDGQQQLRDLLSNWERYANNEDGIDPLIRMAVLHYQFEAIHPFTDGNGRTGRILNVLYLIQAELLDIPTLYLSRHIVRTKADYYKLLLGVTTQSAWEPWLCYILEAVRSTATWTNQRIRAIRDLMQMTADHVRSNAASVYSRKLVETLFSQPYVRIAHLIEKGVAQRVAASRYLKALVEIGVLEEEKVGRDKVFIHRKYMELLGSDGHTFEPYPAKAQP